MKAKWTEEQLRAINERGRNILVSAGAGSGKTAVMVERVVGLVLTDRVPVSAMLIVTFTKAAASEMKERLRNALKDRLTEALKSAGPEAEEEQAWIKEQLDSLHTAQISTFHSFAQRVLKEFFYFTDIEPGFRVLDQAEDEVLKEQAMEELFDSEYDEDREDFREFLDAYSGEKNDSDARVLIQTLYTRLEAVPGRFKALEEKAEELSSDVEGFRKTDTYEKLRVFIDSQIDAAIREVQGAVDVAADAGLQRMADMIRDDGAPFDLAREAADKGDTDRAVDILNNSGFCTLRARADEKESYTDDVKNQIKALRDGYKGRIKGIQTLYYADLKRMVRTMQHTEGYAKTLVRLEKRFDEIFQGLKRDIGGIDYSDMEHYAYDILQHDEAASYYRDLFRYIFIDEYQDTNVMQETIIGMIKREDDLFMVGDIKQSIYHFRLADPDIFKNKYAEYKEEGKKGDQAGSVKIDLNRNFRSKSIVIDEINKMFRPIMEGYDKDAELVQGSPDGAHVLKRPETRIIDTAKLAVIEDEEVRDIKAEELEAMEAVRIIRENLGKEYTDSKSGETRKVDYKDIVILMRSFKRSAEGYRSVFRDAGVPLYIDDESGYFDTIEINVFMSLLSVIDNKRQDVPFIAILRSEIFGFTCTELAEIRKYHMQGSFVDAAMSDAEDPVVPAELREKIKNVFDKIKTWQAYAVTLPLSDLIWRLMNETGYYIMAGALPGGAVRQANLRLLAERAKSYAERSFGSLYGFIQYIEQVKRNKVEMPQAALLSENENVVRIMTIHHSKGLEFPVVIVAGLDRMHRTSDGGIVSFDRETGLGLRAVDPANHLYENSLVSRLIQVKEKSDEADEMKRVYYVAVTRARETFYLLGCADYAKLEENLASGKTSDSSLLRMSLYLPGLKAVDPDELKAYFDARGKDESVTDDFVQETSDKVTERLDYDYPYRAAGTLAAKTSVTGLNKENMKSMLSGHGDEAQDDIMLRTVQDHEEAEEDMSMAGDISPRSERKLAEEAAPEFIKGTGKLTAAERGTAYHGVMEHIDFVRAAREGTEYIRNTMEHLAEAGVFTEEEMRAVDPEKIMGFFRTDLGKRAAAAAEKGCLSKEQTFESRIQVSGEDVLVQGVIDCFFEEDGGIVLLDYKTNFVDRSDIDGEKERIKAMYRIQLDMYADSIEAALGKTVKEKYLYLFNIDDEVKVG